MNNKLNELHISNGKINGLQTKLRKINSNKIKQNRKRNCDCIIANKYKVNNNKILIKR